MSRLSISEVPCTCIPSSYSIPHDEDCRFITARALDELIALAEAWAPAHGANPNHPVILQARIALSGLK